MKKIIIFSFFLALFSSKAFAQKDIPPYSGEIGVTGLIEKVSMGNYSVSEKRIALHADGGYNHVGYSMSYNLIKKKVGVITIGYHGFKETENGPTIQWVLGPSAFITPNFDPQKSKAIHLGAGGFFYYKKEGSPEFKVKANFGSKLKNNNGDWGQSILFFEAEGMQNFGPLFALGLKGGFLQETSKESMPTDPNIQYNGYVYSESRTSAGLFVALTPKSFKIMLGPEVQRSRWSQSQNNQAKIWSAGNWLVGWRATVIYAFNN